MKKTRQELQDEAVEAVLKDHRVIVNWGTGVGKSRVAVRCAELLAGQGRWRILLLVAETAHKDNWRREFCDALGEDIGEDLFSTLTVECYASLPKYEWTDWDFIIADEAHHLRSESRTDLISTLSSDYFLALSATMSCGGDAEDLLRMLEMSHGEFRQLDFGIQEAIDSGILGRPTIYVHFLRLEDFRIRQPIVEQWGGGKKRVELECDFENRGDRDRAHYPAARLTMMATPGQAYGYYTQMIESAKKAYLKYGDGDAERRAFLETRIKLLGSYRKKCLGQSKTTFARWLIDKRIGDRKAVCFCASVDQARALGGVQAICAENGKNNAEVISAFNEGRSSRLFAVGMAKEGLNLTGIETGLVIQLGGKERDFIQEIGRAFRSRTPEQHIIVIQGTRDEDYFDKNLDLFDPKYIKKLYYGSAKHREQRESSVAVQGHPGLYNIVKD